MTWGVCSEPAIGYDLAHWQGTEIPWAASMAAGVLWSISKAWHGRFTVASAAKQIYSARAAGLPIFGRYAWMLPDDDLAEQVKQWTAFAGEPDELPLTIDFEDPNTPLRGAALMERLEWCVQAVADKIGERPIVYTGDWYMRDFCHNVDSEIVASCPLHLAAYPRKVATGTRYREAVAEVCGGAMPAVPTLWRSRGFEPLSWQFDGDRGLYLPGPGIDVDVNVADWPRLFYLATGTATHPAPGPSFPDTAATPLGWADRADRDLDEAEEATLVDRETPTARWSRKDDPNG